MSDAKDFNLHQMEDGKLTMGHVTKLVRFWQKKHGLAQDGKAGPKTLESLGHEPQFEIKKCYPLMALHDGRPPVITSAFKDENPGRSNHNGVDFFYEYLDSDPQVRVGDGGAIVKKGKRRWWYPEGACAVAAADGTVMMAGEIGTGFRCWIDHGNGERSGYFHGYELLVEVGEFVEAGQAILIVGDSPKGHDGKHLHFEVSPVHTYAPFNPRKWLEGADILDPVVYDVEFGPGAYELRDAPIPEHVEPEASVAPELGFDFGDED